MNDFEDAYEAEWADKVRTKGFRRARTERKALEKARRESRNA